VAQPDEHRVDEEDADDRGDDQLEVTRSGRAHADVDRLARGPRIDERDARRREQADECEDEAPEMWANERQQAPQHREPAAVARLLFFGLRIVEVRPACHWELDSALATACHLR
jgi:hypothetical protein